MIPFICPDNTQCGLIKTSLRMKETSWHEYEYFFYRIANNLLMYRENRYLLFLTENYAALEILKQYLQDQEGTFPQCIDQSDESVPQSTGELDELSLKPWEMEPFVLFGSSFPKDKEYTQVIGTIKRSSRVVRNWR